MATKAFKSKQLIGQFFIQINLLLLFLLISKTAFSQATANIYVISPIVGDTIDSEEKGKFRIFPYYKTSEFQYGIFYQLSESTYLLKSIVKDSMIEKVFSKEEIIWNKKMIERGGSDNDDSTKLYKIELKDGSVFIGNILQKDSIYVVIKTSSIPKIEIPVIKIKSINEVDKSNYKNGSYWFSNPNATRYLFGPSAFNLKKGEGYYQNTYIFLNSFNIGITNNVSIGGGLELISTFGSLASGSFNPIFFITPKVGFKVTEKFHAGGGVLYASIPSFGSGSRSGLGIAYGIGTYGTLDHNVTGGLGWGFIEGEFSERPIITLSGMTRISKKMALVTENWFIPTDNYNFYSYGIRFFGEKIAVDFAFINNSDIFQTLFIGLPYVDFVVKF